MKNIMTGIKSLMFAGLLFIAGQQVVFAQHMDNHDQDDHMMGDPEQTMQMGQHMEDMQQLHDTNMMGIENQHMMMSMDQMMEHLDEMMDQGEAMMARNNSRQGGGLMNMFRGQDPQDHMLDMTEDMTSMMASFNGVMENMESMMQDESFMAHEGTEQHMEHMQQQMSTMVELMDAMMNDLDRIESTRPQE